MDYTMKYNCTVYIVLAISVYLSILSYTGCSISGAIIGIATKFSEKLRQIIVNIVRRVYLWYIICDMIQILDLID